MTSSAETQQSVTIADYHRRREEARRFAGLFVLGDALGIAPPRNGRVVAFDNALHIGRRAPSAATASAWIIRDPLVSSQHCVISKEGDSYRLTDLQSRNG